ncbi:MAG: methylenetetrahydrofolate reductase [NAD(P)H] [Deltaproteobacteria bacterium]|nr:methylenetetrahydrofolate reductase [NAD(P)H] [Deltaproteobacteria bacterium]
MKIKDMLLKDTFTLSFEVFPPKREGNLERLYLTIQELVKLEPHFISVTYGAGGGTKDKTVEIASTIKNKLGTEVLAHLTCVQATKDDIAEVLNDFKNENIENVLALRGDPPQEEKTFIKTAGGLGYANELVEFIRAHDDFSIGVAGYPEGHIEAPDLDIDIANLKRKVDAGADFIITQLFFNNDDFYRFRDRAIAQKIAVPIIAGIFPIFNYKQIAKMVALSGAKIPSGFHDKIYKVSDKSEEVEKYGIEYAIVQSEHLLENDVSGLHFYCMNKSDHITQIVRELSLPTQKKIAISE